MATKVRVRFAPSPTGKLHLGGARTALFNFLFAKHNQGTFILRIEDTDFTRSTKEDTEAILRELKWLGIIWDEGPDAGGKFAPYFQSQRLEHYQRYAKMLLNSGKAYYCYCPAEELEKKRKQAQLSKEPPKYDGKCRELTPKERERLEKEGRSKVIRFKLEDKEIIVVKDLIKGEIKFDPTFLDDFIIIKSDNRPVYNFAAVIDDTLMKISHIIRGDDHISNTPRQILLYQALGFSLPQLAHIPMITGPGGVRLSKRHGAISLSFYREEGYLPKAMLNYLSRLGWSYNDKQEIFSQEELIEKFSLEGVSKNPALFDLKKLSWLNGYYLRKTNLDKLTRQIIPYWRKAGYLEGKISKEKYDYLKRIVKLLQERLKHLSEAIELADFFFLKEVKFEERAVNKFLKKEYVKGMLEKLRKTLKGVEPFEEEVIEDKVRGLAEELNLKTAKIIHPIRVILTGRETSPPLFEVMTILGKEKVLEMISNFLTISRGSIY